MDKDNVEEAIRCMTVCFTDVVDRYRKLHEKCLNLLNQIAERDGTIEMLESKIEADRLHHIARVEELERLLAEARGENGGRS